MPGFKTFANNDLLTAADVNNYLMRQVTAQVADQSERDAIPAPSPGMTVWRLDHKVIEQYNGAGWDRLARASGTVISTAAAGGGSAPVYWSDLLPVVFPVNLFTAVPKVFVQTVGPDGQVPFGGLVEQITVAGCKVRAMRIAAQPNTTQFKVNWLAVQ